MSGEAEDPPTDPDGTGTAGLAHGEDPEDPGVPLGGLGDVLDLDEGMVVSLVESRREEALDIGIGEEATF